MSKNQKQVKKSSDHRVSLFRRPWMIFIILLVLVAIVIALLIYFKPNTESAVDQPQPTSTPTNSDQPADQADGEPSSNPEDPEDKTTQYEGEDPNTLEELTGSVARKTVSGDQLTVVATIDQYLIRPGLCIIEMKNSAGQLVYTASSDAVADVTTSICEPFVIPADQIGSGKYTIEIQINGDGKQGIITEEVEL